MTDLWENIKRSLTQGYKSVSEKTEELTKIGRIKIEIIAVKRDIEKSFVELGGKVYHRLDKSNSIDISEDEDMKRLVDQIKTDEKKLRKLEKDLVKIQTAGKKEDSG